jgi:predicted ribosomally synthesized peptide with SipW-like signal peptide
MKKLEDSLFQNGSLAWKIFLLSDTTQIATTGFGRGTMPGGRTVQHTHIAALGLFTVGTFTSLTDVEDSQTNIPNTFGLNQNYPNPFNPSTTIRYALPKRSAVQLKIFNILGQQVALLQNGEQEAGYHEVRFDGRNLSSGVYFYRIQAGSFVETKKLLMIR